AALLNDTVSCPEHGMNKIIECDVSAYEENGRGIILHGCKTQCGASVIASYAAISQ
ncbi:PAAR domain-containing protein, partial [Enterobacter hormaechei]|nr:PAAR domain-containing protein [Enterobacter hormaechei]